MTKKAKLKLAKITAPLIIVSAMLFAGSTTVSAATVSYGMSGELTAESQTDSGASVTATVKNANYYDIDGVNYKISVSDNAEISGDTQKTDVFLPSEQSDSLTVNVSLKSETPSDSSSDEAPSDPSSDETPSDPSSDETPSDPSSNETPSDSPSDTTPSDSTPDTDGSVTTSEPSQPGTSTPGDSNNSGTTVTDGENVDQSTIKTGDDSFLGIIALLIAVMLVSAAAVLVIVKKNRRMMSVMLCFTLASSVLAVSIPMQNAKAADEGGYTVIEDKLELEFEGETVTVTLTVEFPEQPEIHDNTETDIKALNNGDATILRYKDSNEVSFINGRYTDYKVTNWETALSSLQAVKMLLNANEDDIEIIPLRVDVTDNGDTYYTFEQVQGLATVTDAFIKIGVDKDGNTLCLSSSIDPTAAEIDVSEDDINVSVEKAKDIAADYCEQHGFTLLDIGQDPALSVQDKNVCWEFYLQRNNTGDQPSADNNQYFKLFVSIQNGEVFDIVSVSSIETDSGEYDNDVYFNVETQDMTFTDSFGKEVVLPVAKNESGYYFVDTERKILCVDSQKTYFDSTGPIIPDFYVYTFENSSDINPVFVTAFENVRNVYDFYKAHGIESVDGNGMPISVGFGYGTTGGVEQPNAGYLSNFSGFACFAFSSYPVSTSLDTAAHEFSHAIRRSHNASGAYFNDTGAIEEAYADILGNLIEMQIDPDNSDLVNWYISEQSGTPTRSMADPHMFAQPEFVGDVFYEMNSRFPTGTIDDHGGVHTNSSILAHVCYQMSQSGISMADNFEVWKDTLYLLTPKSKYREVAGLVEYSLKRNGLSQYIDTVNSIFDKAQLDNDTTSWDGYEKPDGAIEVNFVLQNAPDDCVWSGIVFYKDPDMGTLVQRETTCDINNTAKGYYYPLEQAIILLWIAGDASNPDGFNPIIYEGPLTEDRTFTIDYNEIMAGTSAA